MTGSDRAVGAYRHDVLVELGDGLHVSARG
jgi:hypothetical protein